MTSSTQHRWVVVGLGGLGLGLFSIFAVRTIKRQLDQIRCLNQVSQKQKRPHVVCQETEDALKLDTLQKLADGSNWDLRAAAHRIITERSTKGPTYGLLLENINSKDEVVQYQALIALRFLAQSPAGQNLDTLATLKALTDCLCSIASSRFPNGRSTMLSSPTQARPQRERIAMTILLHLMRFARARAVEAGVISRWLANYPLAGINDDLLLSKVASSLALCQPGVKELRSLGLRIDRSEPPEGDAETWVVGEQGAAVPSPRLGSGAVGRRVREESVEELALRRRRREAMIIHEGSQPLSNADIIQREADGSDGNAEQLELEEQQIEQLMDEVRIEDQVADDQDGRLNSPLSTGWPWRYLYR